MKKIKLSLSLILLSTMAFAQVHTDDAGNVGIGTKTPEHKLSVLGNISSTIGSNEGGALFLENTFKTANDASYRWALYNMTGSYGNSLQFWNYNKNFTVYGPKLTIRDDGNVGIGTSNPTSKLDVIGTIQGRAVIKLLDYSNIVKADFAYDSAIDQMYLYGYKPNSIFSIYTGGKRQFDITSTGNVGIGNTSPEHKLSVSGNISSKTSTNEGGAIFLENDSKTATDVSYRWALYNMTGSYGNSLQFWNYNREFTAYGPKLTIADDGSVGIGTTTPTAKLQVNGSAKFQGNTFFTGDYSEWFDEANRPLAIAYNRNSNVYLVAGTSTGNVGIGTNAPREKLSVNGKIRAHEIKVEQANWPDYVFEDSYKNLSLKEVEKFIKKNKHLPDMPTAAAIEKNGLALGEIVKLQQQKIEELTLHLIQQEKLISTALEKIDIQQKEIQNLKKHKK